MPATLGGNKQIFLLGPSSQVFYNNLQRIWNSLSAGLRAWFDIPFQSAAWLLEGFYGNI